MSYVIPAPAKIEFPEQVALSDKTDGSRSDVAASEKSVGLVSSALSNKASELTGSIEQVSLDVESAKQTANSGVSKGDSAQAKADSAYALAQDAKNTAIAGQNSRTFGAVDTYTVAQHTNYIVNGLKCGQNISGGNLKVRRAGQWEQPYGEDISLSGVWKLVSMGTNYSNRDMTGLFLRIS
ncbi:hypothetical protein [Vibrio sp. SCSIO 43137]|uniref:hypothetical protein n=1 Tax=Vibrio sp. SCSIO 43137 TaxID=3021011 RepID=UPI002307CB6B|nr:hypothetical protein [Vibrio sp. SCSIO 43137]WCE29972.1 hypothetical protein PK654_01275 [Vibrio sp. SCSIO 43137]